MARYKLIDWLIDYGMHFDIIITIIVFCHMYSRRFYVRSRHGFDSWLRNSGRDVYCSLLPLVSFCSGTSSLELQCTAWSPAGFIPGVGKLKGLGDGSYPAWFGGGTPVRARGWSPQGQYWIEYLYLLLATPSYYQYGRCFNFVVVTNGGGCALTGTADINQ